MRPTLKNDSWHSPLNVMYMSRKAHSLTANGERIGRTQEGKEDEQEKEKERKRVRVGERCAFDL